MKTLYLTLTVVVLLLLYTNGIQAQTTQTKLNQVELAKQFLGTWQLDRNKDTVNILEAKPYGKAFIMTNYQVIKGNKSDLSTQNVGYDDRDDKIKSFVIMPNSDYMTWIGMFTTDKLIKSDVLDTFKPEIVWGKNEVEFKTPTEMIIRGYDAKGVKTGEWTWKKIK